MLKITGYPDRYSVAPGEDIAFKVSLDLDVKFGQRWHRASTRFPRLTDLKLLREHCLLNEAGREDDEASAVALRPTPILGVLLWRRHGSRWFE